MIARSEKSSRWSDAAVLFFGNLVIGLLFVNEGLFHYDSVVRYSHRKRAEFIPHRQGAFRRLSPAGNRFLFSRSEGL